MVIYLIEKEIMIMENEEFSLPENSGITLQEIETLCRSIVEQRAVIAEISKNKKEEDQKLDKLEAHFIETLHKIGKKSYRSEHGTLGISYRTSFKVPQTEEDRQAFFNYLKEQGVYDRYVTVKSTDLNTFAKAEMEKELANGNDDFKIPGLQEPTIDETLSVRKGR